MTGRALLRLLSININQINDLSCEILIGNTILSIFILVICFLFKSSADIGFIIYSIFGIGATALNSTFPTKTKSSNFIALAMIGVISGFSILWSWQAIISIPKLKETGVFSAWPDYFYHASLISQFAKFSDMGGTWIFARGMEMPLYHYASYMIPATLVALSGLPSLTAAMAFWVPYSYINMGLGAWTLGSILGNRLGGIAAVVSIFMVPNAAHYGFMNPYFDFHWLMQISASGYAVGLSLLTLGLGVIALETKPKTTLILAASFVLIISAFKMQIFVILLFSVFLIFILLYKPKKSLAYCLIILFFIIGGMFAVIILEHFPRAPHFLTTGWTPRASLEALMQSRRLHTNLPTSVAIPLETADVILSATGALCPLYIVLLIISYFKKISFKSDFFSLYFIFIYISIILFFPYNVGDEYQHRSFVLLYSVLSIWCSSILCRLILQYFSVSKFFILTILTIFFIPFPFIFEHNSQSENPIWAQAMTQEIIPRGLILSAEYIRTHAQSSDVVLKSSDDGQPPFFVTLTALCERSAYIVLLKGHEAWTLWGSDINIVNEREKVALSILNSKTYEEFSRIANNAGINWYVLSPTDHFPNDITDMAEIKLENYYIFHLSNNKS
jgi:hypothetical protein